MAKRMRVARVGTVAFSTPKGADHYLVMAERAIRSALSDPNVDYASIQQAYAGYVYGDSTCGQNAVYQVGMTGIRVVNVNNNCSTGSSALWLARQAIEHGAADCMLGAGQAYAERHGTAVELHDCLSGGATTSRSTPSPSE